MKTNANHSLKRNLGEGGRFEENMLAKRFILSHKEKCSITDFNALFSSFLTNRNSQDRRFLGWGLYGGWGVGANRGAEAKCFKQQMLQ